MDAAKKEHYATLLAQLKSLLTDERDFIANAANTASLIYHTLSELNWAGFYLLRGDSLVIGPFQGRPACSRIAIGQGVCGMAAERRETLVVADVGAFAGHIACDATSKSEIVVPLIRRGRLIGVLDCDSPVVGRFDEEDRAGLEGLVALLLDMTDSPPRPRN